MKFFLDSAQVTEIQYALKMWNIEGVTTNPRHVQASGKPFIQVIREIGLLFEGTGSLIQEIAAIRDNYSFSTEIIVAAVRNGRQIVDAALAGADIVTAGSDVFKDAFVHPYTHAGLKKFADFWDKTLYE
jgi:transaldolase